MRRASAPMRSAPQRRCGRGRPMKRNEACDVRGQTSIDQRAAATAQWVEKNRRLLVQSDLSRGEPSAPPALIKLYGVRAQMLAPIEREGRLDGWISVHEARDVRNWTEAEQAALRKAAEQVRRE